MLQIKIIPCRQDNYAYLIHNKETSQTALIDAPEAEPIQNELDRNGWQLNDILITHKHFDHVEGVAKLYNDRIRLIAPEETKSALPQIDIIAEENQILNICGEDIIIIHTPGHTLGHVCYYFPKSRFLFCADTLFSMGCGRIFEGDFKMMWQSLQKLMQLPDSTQVFCGHEYTQTNIRFALSQTPDNPDLRAKMQQVDTLRSSNHPTIPTTLSEEKKLNPFINENNFEKFKSLRTLKNSFS